MAETALTLATETLQRATQTLARLTTPQPTAAPLETDDIQGLVFRGYGTLKFCCYPLLKVTDKVRARAWLRSQVDVIARGKPAARESALQIAFTHAGFAALGLPANALEGFSREFIVGMTGPYRSRFLGDENESAPSNWQWGGPNGAAVHAALMLFADSAAHLSDRLAELRQSWAGAFEEVRVLETAELSDHEHFGFADGISQPALDGFHEHASEVHRVKPGEFVLGYPNEYGLYTERPLLEPEQDRQRKLPVDVETSSRPDFGRNGTYLVFRQLRQDVPAFRKTLAALSGNPDGTPNPKLQQRLAAQMVGRWPSGASLIESPDYDDAARAKQNDFRYHAEDIDGLKCPIGAHVRRANPRDALDPDPGSDSSLAVNHRHRLIRRGRSYGAPLPNGVDDDTDRGLVFVIVNGNISRQFEFVQHSWLMDPRFNGLTRQADPIVGTSDNQFSAAANPVRVRCTGLPRFVTVTGGAYFFMPGIRALRFLAEFVP
ncbi:MAG TPA: Dyp-type peroxidase [Polyangiales bacterium]|nr:Dyp-type peroxidase [Polyangiales bacterium]